jgi:AcrR family transcriptional regulator
VAVTATPTRERLLQAALELTRDGGYAAASVAAVAERAGVSRGALYRHWASKGELFAELFRTVCTRELAAMQQAGEVAGGTAPASERIEAVLSTFAGRALHAPRLAWALIAEPVDPLVEAARLAYRRTYRENLAVLLQEAVDNGEIPPQDVTLTAAALVGALGEALVGPTSPPAGEVPPAAEILAALRLFVRRAIGAA